MALAPFFDKTALAAAAVLQGFDREQFAATLESKTILVAFDDAAVHSFEGRTTLILTVNLAARLYPTLSLVAHDAGATAFRPELERIARAVNPNIELGGTVLASAADGVAVIVGESEAHTFGFGPQTTVTYVGSRGWEARVSTLLPVGSGSTELPFGAAAAACLGAANLFRHIFRDQLPNGGPDNAVSFSTLSLTTQLGDSEGLLDSEAPVSLAGVDLGEAVLIGAGAVGQGCLWTLTRARDLKGTLHVVDGEAVDGTNPQRYVLATSVDRGTRKAALAAELLNADNATPSTELGTCGSAVRHVSPSERAALTVVPHEMRWGAFLARRPAPWRLDKVLVALDSARDRIAVQSALPRWIANAWTQPGDLGISRHHGLGQTACLACLYIPASANALNEDMLIADAVGLAGQHMLVRQLLATNAPVDEAVIALMAAGLSVPPAPLLAFAGRPLRAFYSEAVCGGVVLRLQGQQGEQHAGGVPSTAGQPRDRAGMVPMAFQSVLAGVLLAAAAAAEATGLPTPPPGQKAVLNLLRPVTARLLVPVARHSSGKCLCHDADYLATFEAHWGASRADTALRSNARHEGNSADVDDAMREDTSVVADDADVMETVPR